MSRQIEIGYEGGTIVRLTLDDAAAEKLLEAVDGGGWHRVDAYEGTHALNLEDAVYVRLEDRPEQIGFGGS